MAEPSPLRMVADLRPIRCPHGIVVEYRDAISGKRYTGRACHDCQSQPSALTTD